MYYYLLRIPGNTGRFTLDFLVKSDVEADEEKIALALSVKYRQKLMDYLKFDTYGTYLTLKNYVHRIGGAYTEASARALTDNFINKARIFEITKDDLDEINRYKPRDYKEAKDIISYINDRLEFMEVKEAAYEQALLETGVFTDEFVLSGGLKKALENNFMTILDELKFRKGKSGIIWNDYWIGFEKNTYYYLEPRKGRQKIPGKTINLDENKKVFYKPYEYLSFDNGGKRLLKVGESAVVVEDEGDETKTLDIKTKQISKLSDGDVVIVIGITNPRWCGKVGVWTKGGVVFTDEQEIIKPYPNDVVKVGRIRRKNIDEETGGGDVGITTNDITSGAIPGIITTPTKMLKYKNKSGTILNIFYSDKKGNKTRTGITKRRGGVYRVKSIKEDGGDRIMIVREYPSLKRALQAVVEDVGRVYEPRDLWLVGESVVVGYEDGEKILWNDGWGVRISDEILGVLPEGYSDNNINVGLITDYGFMMLLNITESSIITDKGAVPLTFLNHAILIDDIDVDNAKTCIVSGQIKAVLLMPDGQEKYGETITEGRYTLIPSKDKTVMYLISRENKKVYKVLASDYRNYIKSGIITEQVLSDEGDVMRFKQEFQEMMGAGGVDKTKALVEAIKKAGYDVPQQYYSSLAPSKIDYIRYNYIKNFKPYEVVKIVDSRDKNKVAALAAFLGTVGIDKVDLIILESYVSWMQEGDRVIVHAKNITK